MQALHELSRQARLELDKIELQLREAGQLDELEDEDELSINQLEA